MLQVLAPDYQQLGDAFLKMFLLSDTLELERMEQLHSLARTQVITGIKISDAASSNVGSSKPVSSAQSQSQRTVFPATEKNAVKASLGLVQKLAMAMTGARK